MKHRFWEVIPGAAAWATLAVLVLLSRYLPAVVVIFILFYDLYWLLRVVYFFFHLSFSFREMRARMKVNWLHKLEREKAGYWENIVHLIVLPVYHEPWTVVRRTIVSIAEANYPKDKMFVVLATEERGGPDDAAMAAEASREFGSAFGAFLVTRHPADLPRESPGKGSNETWATRAAVEALIRPGHIDPNRVVVSVFDADTRPGPDYFGLLTNEFLSNPKGERASFQPVPIYVNNLATSPFIAHIVGFSSTFWQLMQSSRPDQLVTFSSHSMPLTALMEIGYWDTDLVSEDSRIFFQCLAHWNGDWRTVPLFYPVYMDAVVGKDFWNSLGNLYLQQRRWGWGTENLARFAEDTKRRNDFPRKARRFWIWVMFDGFYSWSTSAIVIFVFGWLPNVIGGDAFRASLISYNLPRMTGLILNFSLVGIIALALWSAAILRTETEGISRLGYLLYILGWVLTPLTTIIFGAIPALEAQTRLMLGGKYRLGFWKTPKAANE
ncbi:glycosyltransferase family 2 protein [Patescibacteria group bacterium]|nr:glycosyltransferase family 2 protein [Patescibacteria group bacterium]